MMPRLFRAAAAHVSGGRGADPRGSIEAAGSAAPNDGYRTARGHRKLNPTNADANMSTDLEQLEPYRAATRVGKGGVLQPDPPHGTNQNISQ